MDSETKVLIQINRRRIRNAVNLMVHSDELNEMAKDSWKKKVLRFFKRKSNKPFKKVFRLWVDNACFKETAQLKSDFGQLIIQLIGQSPLIQEKGYAVRVTAEPSKDTDKKCCYEIEFILDPRLIR